MAGLRSLAAGVVLSNEDGILHPIHIDVLERNVAHIIAAVARGLDADPIIRAFEVNPLGMDMLHTARNLAPNRKSMPMLKCAIGNRDVLTRSIWPRRINRSALNRDVVIAR